MTRKSIVWIFEVSFSWQSLIKKIIPWAGPAKVSFVFNFKPMLTFSQEKRVNPKRIRLVEIHLNFTVVGSLDVMDNDFIRAFSKYNGMSDNSANVKIPLISDLFVITRFATGMRLGIWRRSARLYAYAYNLNRRAALPHKGTA